MLSLEPSEPRTEHSRSLIPVESISHISLSPVYHRNSQNAGLRGRPTNLPLQNQVERYLNQYLTAQKAKPRQVTKLIQPSWLPMVLRVPVSPFDSILKNEAREKNWNTHLGSMRKSQHASTLCGKKNPKIKIRN